MPALPALLHPLVVVAGLDPAPEPEDVKAGYPALFLFLGLLVIIGLLGWSLVGHLRRVEVNRDAGAFGDAPPAGPAPAASGSASTPGSSGDPIGAAPGAPVTASDPEDTDRPRGGTGR